MQRFIYVVSAKTYYDQLRKKGTYKHIPEFLLKIMDKKISGNILTEIKFKEDIIGYCIGITMREDLTKDELASRIEDFIENKSPIEKINVIIFENDNDLIFTKTLIEKNILEVTDISKDIKIKTIPFVLKKLVSKIKRFNKGIELLIIPEKKDDVSAIIEKNLSDIKYISVYTESEEIGNSVFDDAIKDIGLSIEIIKDLSKINRFDVIINFRKNINFIKWVKRNSIVFNIYNNLSYENNSCIIVDDFTFDNLGLMNNVNKNISFKEEIPSSIYSYKETFDIRDFRRLEINKNLYNLEEICDRFIVKK
ncbi:hypothetical protein GOQ29_08730 [Clostridium sp. D2Q-14]|uniref:hypothetical protein n=1 Tax=Anaeromonas gelatinilytica TaxID=2683194 RepID=UPI00193C15B6|nr:hypothetical protein [Anaeromonas gelatinilytica]MBS4535700.1 hypothetical protein [Anaeromonas gelatinilytica]